LLALMVCSAVLALAPARLALAVIKKCSG
jgi:hypothetical protein